MVARNMMRLLAALLACLSLTACETVATPPAAAAGRPLLAPRQVITGARLTAVPGLPFGTSGTPATTAFLHFRAPSAVAARGSIMYVFDSGYRQVFRFDATQQAMTRFTDFGGTADAMAVASDLSLYIAGADARQVLHFSWDGKPLPRLADETVLARPVAVVVDDMAGQVLVADSLYNHVVVFDSLGRAHRTLKSLETHSIESMARGPDGLYLLDRLGRQVVVMGMDGRDRYVFGEGLNDPQAIVVDRFNRVFIADAFDNTIKVFEGGRRVAGIGGSGPTPGHFNRISFMALDQNTLYVADSLNTRIQTFHIAPPATRPAGAGK